MLRGIILTACAAIIVLGCVLIAKSNATPEWKDPDRAEVLLMSSMPPEQWFSEMRAIRTEKWPLFDLGTGLIALVVSALLVAAMLELRTFKDVASLSTSSHRWVVALLAIIAWLAHFGSLFHYAIQTTERAESYGDALTIPFYALQASFIAMTPAYITVLVGMLWRSRLPANLWLWPSGHLMRKFVTTTITAVVLGLTALFTVDDLLHGPYSAVPARVLFVYVVLSLRAAAMSRGATGRVAA